MMRLLFTAAAVALATSAYAAPTTTMETMGANKILADAQGMVLYTYDKDTKGEPSSACTATCPANWPAFVPAAADVADGDWTITNGLAEDGKT